jgi:hypothetical protein
MIADFFTKPLQGSLFKKLRAKIMSIDEQLPLPITTTGPQECVAAHSWADIVRKKMVRTLMDGDSEYPQVED